MKYLDMVIHETLRMHPLLALITRAAIKDCEIPGTGGISVKKGSEIHINVPAIHYDPKNYPNPEQFNPENFSKENCANRHPYAFLGFGQGPRSCLGMRFALLEAKMALFIIFSRFRFLRCHKTTEKPVYDTENTFMSFMAAKDYWVKVERR